MGAAFLVVLVAMAVRDRRRARAMERTNETVRVLGNSYYAIYRVNHDEGTYEMIKGSDYVRERIPPRGPYPDLLRTAGEVIEENTFREFEESFSAENIRELVANRVRDYGGDFLRKFGERTAGSTCACSMTSRSPPTRWCCASARWTRRSSVSSASVTTSSRCSTPPRRARSPSRPSAT